MSRRPVILVEDLRRTYEITEELSVHALDGVSMRIEHGDFVAIMGTSGSGKSTLMNIIGCLDVPTGGRYLLDGVDVRDLGEDEQSDLRNRKIGFVFQAFNLVPRTSAVANVELPLSYARVPRRERRARAIAALEAVGMGEPTGNLDSRSTDDVLKIFEDLNAQGRTVVLITHEDEVAARAARTVRFSDGRIVADSAAAADAGVAVPA